MTKKQKKIFLIGGLATGMYLFMKKKKNPKSSAFMNQAQTRAQDKANGFGAYSGAGMDAFINEVGMWFGTDNISAEQKREWRELGLPDTVTDSDINDYAMGKDWGYEPSGYTQQDYLLIEGMMN